MPEVAVPPAKTQSRKGEVKEKMFFAIKKLKEYQAAREEIVEILKGCGVTRKLTGGLYPGDVVVGSCGFCVHRLAFMVGTSAVMACGMCEFSENYKGPLEQRGG